MMICGPLCVLFIILCGTLSSVLGDRIIIHQPTEKQTFTPGSDMLIDYAVQFEGMARLGSTMVTIMKPDFTIINFLPKGRWVNDNGDRRGTNVTWTIPETMEPGDYVVHVAGPSSYMCSVNNNGQPPYTRCASYIMADQSFTIV
ncbi:hypothetical protein DM01DRAFT_135452 [Hesseltinella vesiculosa]|uniref:Uncharacterized protein n=1 Tax=Hesseltinella vesiculosa TaxID=101127 RepID=A0A1X2GKJ4_9FUNG|nr:hypothetical protein DM01DRAFT_135452 [Hesseltinella vesiculosa]